MGDDAEHFGHRVSAKVRFGDLDAMGHLNNVALLRILETSRVDYMVDLGLAAHDELTYVLAHLDVDFRAQAFFGEELVCGTRVGRVGRTSITMEQRIWGPGRTVAEARSVLVSLGPDAVTPSPVPAPWRERIGQWERVRPQGA